MTEKSTKSARWAKGQSGNPGGRKAGVPNRLTQAIRDRIATEADPVGALIEIAKGTAAEGAEAPTPEHRLRASIALLHKLLPDARTAELPILAQVRELKTAEDVRDAIGQVIAQMAVGDLSPAEAEAVIRPLDAWRQAHTLSEIERRLSEIEGQL